MEFKVSDLKKFKSLSSHVRSNGVLPIHDYLKFGGEKIQKVATSSFIKFDCKEANEDLLVDEKTLYDLLANSNAPTITITSVKGKTVISDGKKKISIQVPDLKLFSDIVHTTEDIIDVSPEFVEAIGSAAELCQPMGTIPDRYMYVMIGNKSVCGISISYGYYRPILEDVKLVLEKKTALFLSKTDVCKFSETTSHYLFYTPESTLGFTKHEMGYGDFASMLRNDPGELTFTCSNSELKSYNSLAITLGDNPIVTMKEDGTLDTYDSEKDVSQDMHLPGLKPFEEFSYSPSSMNSILSALYTEELDFYQKSTHLIIVERDKKAVAVIGKIQKV
jgi:hypothetical protein